MSRYIWRGHRLTDDWSIQPSFSVGVHGMSFGMWGNLDLTAANEGGIGRLLLPENPAAPPGARGLKYRLSEVDYVVSYGRSLDSVRLDTGVIFYTFPDRSEILGWTYEFYGGLGFDGLPLAPRATLFVDADESRKTPGVGPAVYFQIEAGQSFRTNQSTFHGIDVEGSLALVNSDFGRHHFSSAVGGPHDASFTVRLPIRIDRHFSASVFVTYSALLGEFRNFQRRDPRAVYLGTAGSPASYADTLWGGFTVSLGF